MWPWVIAVSGLAAALAGLDLDGFAAHGEDLSDAGEVEIAVEFAGDPDGSPLAAAMLGLWALVCSPAPARRCPRREPDIAQQGRLVAF